MNAPLGFMGVDDIRLGHGKPVLHDIWGVKDKQKFIKEWNRELNHEQS